MCVEKSHLPDSQFCSIAEAMHGWNHRIMQALAKMACERLSVELDSLHSAFSPQAVAAETVSL